MNTVDKQDSNLTNFSSKKLVRDYDKEPLIIKNKTNFYIAFFGHYLLGIYDSDAHL